MFKSLFMKSRLPLRKSLGTSCIWTEIWCEFFKKFRSQNIVLSARSYARVISFVNETITVTNTFRSLSHAVNVSVCVYHYISFLKNCNSNKCRERNRIMLKIFHHSRLLKIIFRALDWEMWYRREKNQEYFKPLHIRTALKKPIVRFDVVIQDHFVISKVHIRSVPLPSVQRVMWALEILFTYHGPDLLPSPPGDSLNFPETTSPHQYSVLLPEAWYVLCSLYF